MLCVVCTDGLAAGLVYVYNTSVHTCLHRCKCEPPAHSCLSTLTLTKHLSHTHIYAVTLIFMEFSGSDITPIRTFLKTLEQKLNCS